MAILLLQYTMKQNQTSKEKKEKKREGMRRLEREKKRSLLNYTFATPIQVYFSFSFKSII